MDIWKTVYTVKKILFISLLFLLTCLPLFAEKLSEVSLRHGIQGNNVRIVVESDEDFIRNTNIKFSFSAVILEFPSRFELKKQKDFIFDVTKKDRSLVITLKDAVDFKTYRLSSPARLVFDLKTAPPKQGSPLQPPEQKIQQQTQSAGKKAPDAGKQTGLKVPEAAPQVSPKNPLEAARQEGQKTQPSPPVEKPRRRVVVIDPGHGGYDYGLVSQDAKEKDADLSIAKDLANALSKKGLNVFITRRADQNASLTDRINFSNSKNPDLFMSLHASSVDKFVIYVASVEEANIDTAVKQYSQFSNQNRHIERSRGIAKLIAQSLHAELAADVILRELPLPVLTAMNASAIVLEYPSLKTYNSDQKLRERLVNSVIKGMSAYEQ